MKRGSAFSQRAGPSGRLKLLLGLWFAVLLLPWPALGQIVYPPHYKFLKVPDPLAADNPRYPLLPKALPNPGLSFNDLRFGTVLTRVTQDPALRHEYSRFDPFNCRHSMMLLSNIATGEWLVYRTQSRPYDQAGNLVRTINNLAELRWDRNDPEVLWGVRDFSIITVNVQTGAEVVIKDFTLDATIGPILTAHPYLWRITMKDEGEASRDRRFWALALQNGDDPAHPEESYIVKYLFSWDRLQNKVLGVYPMPLAEGESLDWVGMSPLGNWVIIGGEPEGGGNTGGLVMANKEFTQFHKIGYATGHADVGLDIQGNEVVVMQNSQTDYIDLIPINMNSKVVMNLADYNHNLVKPMVRLYYDSSSPLGLNSGVHISCNYPGYCVISTHIPPGLPEQNWLDRCIILVRLERDKFPAYYLAKIYNTTQQYLEETHAAITDDGAKVVWASNWGLSVPDPQPPNLFVMQLDMPPHWQRQFSASVSPINSLLLDD
jgi:hypothetical protein